MSSKKITWDKIDEDAHAFLLHLETKIMEFGDSYAKLEDKVNKLTEAYSKIEHKILQVENLIQYATGPCNECNGTGMIYVGSESEGRSLPDMCNSCNGSGKLPLDVSSMMEKFKIDARREIRDELPF